MSRMTSTKGRFDQFSPNELKVLLRGLERMDEDKTCIDALDLNILQVEILISLRRRRLQQTQPLKQLPPFNRPGVV